MNRVPFRGRIGRRSLSPGTYRIVARTLPGGQKVVDTRLVVVRHANRRKLRAARGANACPAATVSGSSWAFGTSDPAAGSRAREREKAGQSGRRSGVLGAKFAGDAVSAVKRVPFWLVLVAGISVALLVIAAALPKAAPVGLAASLVVGMVGAAALLLVTIAFTLL